MLVMYTDVTTALELAEMLPATALPPGNLIIEITYILYNIESFLCITPDIQATEGILV
jgi:hypothetical protein